MRFKFLLQTSLILLTETLFTDLEGRFTFIIFHSTVQNIIILIGIPQIL